MPLFVDGVEINEVWVDGVEMDTVFADGVEVFSGANLGDEFFDEFSDVAGTFIENHTMNSGNSWTALDTAGNVTIETYLAGQAAQRTSGSAASINIVPNALDFLAPNSHSIMSQGWNRTAATVFSRMYYATGENYVQFKYESGTNTCWMRVYVNGVVTGTTTTFSSGNATAWLMELFYDSELGQVQARVTINAQVTVSALWNVTALQANYYQINISESQSIQTQIASIDTYQLVPYKSGEVPFP